jgi:hypothetical protein
MKRLGLNGAQPLPAPSKTLAQYIASKAAVAGRGSPVAALPEAGGRDVAREGGEPC